MYLWAVSFESTKLEDGSPYWADPSYYTTEKNTLADLEDAILHTDKLLADVSSIRRLGKIANHQ